MSYLTRVIVNSLQIPVSGSSAAEARAKAVQQINKEPAVSTPPVTENGEPTVITQPTHEKEP